MQIYAEDNVSEDCSKNMAIIQAIIVLMMWMILEVARYLFGRGMNSL
jgi:hypothetical protein